MTNPTKAHIGDGVYVERDDYNVWISTPCPSRAGHIALEPLVLTQLAKWLKEHVPNTAKAMAKLLTDDT